MKKIYIYILLSVPQDKISESATATHRYYCFIDFKHNAAKTRLGCWAQNITRPPCKNQDHVLLTSWNRIVLSACNDNCD